MTESYPIQLPGAFAPAFAVGHDNGSGQFVLAGPANPLPTFAATAPDVPAPLAGSTAASVIAGPFVPAALAPVYCVLSGEWSGSVQVLRSTDGGVTCVPVTIGGSGWGRFTSNACEPVWQESEAGASLWLDIRLDSGTVTYRVSQ